VFGALDHDGTWNVWSVNAQDGSGRRLEIANAVAAQPASDGSAWYFTRPDEAGLWRVAAGIPPARVTSELAAGNTLNWTVTDSAIYFLETAEDSVLLRRLAIGADESARVATLTNFSWPGFSVGSDGAVYYARWDRRDSNLMSVE
jgi:hypothetical protein